MQGFAERSASFRRQVGSLVWLAAVGAACTSTPPTSRESKLPLVPQTTTAASILREPDADPEFELERLLPVKTNPALLRRAFLELRLGHPQAAIEATAEVLYGPLRPGANEESFARYLRAEAYAAKGAPELGTYDRDRARELALDPELRRRLPAKVVAAEPEAAAPVADLELRRRASWQAKVPVRRSLDPMGRVTRLTIHHSAVYFRDTRVSTCVAQVQKIQREHMENSGWADIGYHFLIDPSGRIWEGRELRWQGAHAEGRNNIGNIGICLLGNFMRGRGGQEPTRAQVAAMKGLITQLMTRYDFGPDQIHCHRDFKPTECPGPVLQQIVTRLANDLIRRGGRVATARP